MNTNFKRVITPLRYPGGKQRLTPFIREILEVNDWVGARYAEPYAGGAGVAINLLLAGKVSHIHLNDACAGIYHFWKSVTEQTDELCRLVTATPLTVEEWRKQKEIFSRTSEFSSLEVGFSLFYLNRVNRSGIVGNGGLIGGISQSGTWRMDARFPKAELVRRITEIAVHRTAITVSQVDAETFLNENLNNVEGRIFVYCDPPYFKKADRLYLNHYQAADHSRLANVIQKLKQPWVVSYDAAPEIFTEYAGKRSFVYDLQYSAKEAYKGREAFFFSDAVKIPDRSAHVAVNDALKSFHTFE